jgi:serine/alanine adding enzyme
MKVSICQDCERHSWDAYVDSVQDASQYHKWARGQAIEDTFGHKAYRLAAMENGEIQGILPLVMVRSRVFGSSLVSMPFASYGGIVASTPDAREALVSSAVELARKFRAQRIELRQGAPCDLPWACPTTKVRMEVALPPTVDGLWNRMSSKLRKRIRSARKNGLHVERGGAESLDVFYPIFAENMRNHGTPVYPRRWFENFFLYGPKQTGILSVWDGARPVGAGIVTAHRGTVEWPWCATLRDSRCKFSAVFLYWSLLSWATDNRYLRVDLGRCTPGSGSHGFKRHWGCEEKTLHWYYWLARGAQLPEIRPESRRYRWATQIWRRLPLSVANRLGPRIVRSIP